jgi:hypothetical protein
MVDSFEIQERDCEFRTEVVVKRFVESERVVLVWESLLDIPSWASDNTQLIQKGWFLIQQLYGGCDDIQDTQARAPATVQTCTRATCVNQVLAAGTPILTKSFLFAVSKPCRSDYDALRTTSDRGGNLHN